MLVKMLHREPRIALLIQPQHAQDLRGRCPSARRLADPPIAQALRPLIAQPVAPPPERPLRYPQHLRRFSLRQLAPLMPLEQPLETHLPYPLQHLRPDHPPPPFYAVQKPDRSPVSYKSAQLWLSGNDFSGYFGFGDWVIASREDSHSKTAIEIIREPAAVPVLELIQAGVCVACMPARSP